jgi:hypothetical protein
MTSGARSSRWCARGLRFTAQAFQQMGAQPRTAIMTATLQDMEASLIDPRRSQRKLGHRFRLRNQFSSQKLKMIRLRSSSRNDPNTATSVAVAPQSISNTARGPPFGLTGRPRAFFKSGDFPMNFVQRRPCPPRSNTPDDQAIQTPNSAESLW